MSDHNERACTNCGSLLHHEDDCRRTAASKANALGGEGERKGDREAFIFSFRQCLDAAVLVGELQPTDTNYIADLAKGILVGYENVLLLKHAPSRPAAPATDATLADRVEKNGVELFGYPPGWSGAATDAVKKAAEEMTEAIDIAMYQAGFMLELNERAIVAAAVTRYLSAHNLGAKAPDAGEDTKLLDLLERIGNRMYGWTLDWSLNGPTLLVLRQDPSSLNATPRAAIDAAHNQPKE